MRAKTILTFALLTISPAVAQFQTNAPKDQLSDERNIFISAPIKLAGKQVAYLRGECRPDALKQIHGPSSRLIFAMVFGRRVGFKAVDGRYRFDQADTYTERFYLSDNGRFVYVGDRDAVNFEKFLAKSSRLRIELSLPNEKPLFEIDTTGAERAMAWLKC